MKNEDMAKLNRLHEEYIILLEDLMCSSLGSIEYIV